MTLKQQIKRELLCQKARLNFFSFCQLMVPKFYKPERYHLVELCRVLQGVYDGTLTDQEGKSVTRVMINMPPRHGKSLTLQLFSAWVLGKDPSESIMTICYNAMLAGRFSKAVRNLIEVDRLDDRFVFADIFKNIRIKQGDGSASLWAIEGSHFSYLGGSFGSTITGLGCSIGIIDDPIKNSVDAFNSKVLEDQYQFYVDTFLSRVEEGGKQIVNMTRWNDNDLCGKILKEEAEKWHVVLFQAYDEKTDTMLCSELMSLETYLDKQSKMSEEIHSANYQQITINKKGSLYKNLQKYQVIPDQEGIKKVYIDTADLGKDYLCAIFYKEVNGLAYVFDVIYTQEGQEETEPMVADRIMQHNIIDAIIESNNGGRAFARNIERICYESNYTNTTFTSFHQSENKNARILSNSNNVQRLVLLPDNSNTLFPEFYRDIIAYQKTGKNLHDDCADAITGVVEYINSDNFIVY